MRTPKIKSVDIVRMAQKLFPIFADPNAPSSFDGIDLSLAAGQMTALNGSDSFTMTASTLTANTVSASWADIVDGVVNPPALQGLQSVLDTGSTAIDYSITLQDAYPATKQSDLSSTTLTMLDITADTNSALGSNDIQFSNVGAEASSSMSASSLALTSSNYSSTLSSSSHIFAKGAQGSDHTATLEQTGLTVVQSTGPTALYRYDVSITEGNFNANLSSGQLTMLQNASGATALLSPSAFNMSGSGASPLTVWH